MTTDDMEPPVDCLDTDEDWDALHPAIRGLKTVCRCNNIKYRTIERAIEQGAKSIAQVAAGTTATTGQCGGSCTPRVQNMIQTLAHGASTPAAPPALEEDAWWVRKPSGGKS